MSESASSFERPMGSEPSAPNSSISNIYCLGALVFELCDGAIPHNEFVEPCDSLDKCTVPAIVQNKTVVSAILFHFLLSTNTPRLAKAGDGGGGLGDGSG